MVPETDIVLLESIKKGNYSSFEVLFRSYYDLLCRYAAGIVRSDSLAEDIVSDLMASLWEFPHKITIHTSLKGYLVRSVHNACINHMTRKHRRFEELNPETIDRLNRILPVSRDEVPADQLIGKELEEEIGAVIDGLPAECRKIFRMSRQEALSHREIAEKLNISENTVKVQVYRALVKIREALQRFM